MLTHQNLNVVLGESDGPLGRQIDKLSALCPVILSVRVPIHCKFEHFQHGEGSLLLQLVINVEEGAHEPIVGHRVGDTLGDDAKVEGLVPPTHEVVLEAHMHIPDINPQILHDDALNARQETLASTTLYNCAILSFLELLLRIVQRSIG